MTDGLHSYSVCSDTALSVSGAAPSEPIYYDSITERRDRYFVEYHPPRVGDLFATLTLVFPTDIAAIVVATTMNSEAERWVSRYPLPLMVTAFDKADSPIPLEHIRPYKHLFAWIEEGEVATAWRPISDSEFTEGPITAETLRRVYTDLGHLSQAQITANVEANLKNRRITSTYLSIVMFVGLAIVPAAIAILGWASPFWGVIILVYALIRAATAGLKLLGYIKPSAHDLQRRKKQREMQHFYYHCKRNPQGFARLRGENFGEDTKAEIREQAHSLGISSTAQVSLQHESIA